MDDLISWGRNTKGWSSQIVELADDRLRVNEQLVNVMKSNEERLSKRIQAVEILWRRTGDPSSLRTFFELCRHSGPPTVRRGRVSLMSILREPEMVEALDAPNTEDFAVDPEKFDRWLVQIIERDRDLNEGS